MGKNPAVLFYPNDFIASTALWSDAETGLYIRLLCYQHINGGIQPEDFEQLCGDCRRVRAKFVQHDDGLYYNERMLTETNKRRAYVQSRLENGEKGGRPKNHMDNHMDNHMGNRNINSNNIPILESNTSLEEEKRGVGEKEERRRVIKSIVDYLNKKTGKRFRSDTPGTTKYISARLNEGYVYDDFVKVIDTKSKEWKNTDFEKFLRPDTLFNSEKFPAYLNQKGEKTDDEDWWTKQWNAGCTNV